MWHAMIMQYLIYWKISAPDEKKMNNNSKLRRNVSFDLRDVTPFTTRLINHVLSTWSRSFHPDAETHAKMLLYRMVESWGLFPRPDTISYNNLPNVYTIHRGNVSATEALLRQMEESNHEVLADVFLFHSHERLLETIYIRGAC